MQIAISDLRQLTELLLGHLEESGQSGVDIARDFYWNVATDERYDRYEEPDSLDVGQLTEDWERLQAIRQGKSPPVGYALVWLAAVLRAVGEQTRG